MYVRSSQRRQPPILSSQSQDSFMVMLIFLSIVFVNQKNTCTFFSTPRRYHIYRQQQICLTDRAIFRRESIRLVSTPFCCSCRSCFSCCSCCSLCSCQLSVMPPCRAETKQRKSRLGSSEKEKKFSSSLGSKFNLANRVRNIVSQKKKRFQQVIAFPKFH